MNWKHRELVTWKDIRGWVNFIDKDYITICIKEWLKEEEVRIHARRPHHQCNVVCSNIYWNEVEREESNDK